MTAYSHAISSSSFAVGTEVLSIFCDAIPLTGSIPAGTYPNGVNVTALTSNGTKTPVDSAGSELRVKTIADVETVYATPADVPLTHDAINPDYDVYNLQSDVSTVGYEGTNFALSFSTNTSVDKNTRSLKQGEVYRIGLVYYDEYMQRTPAKWMCDIKIPRFTPSTAVFLDCEFTGNAAIFQAEGVVSFQLVIVKREPKDRSVSAPGFIVPGVEYEWSDTAEPATGYVHPYYTLKRMINFTDGGDIYEDYTIDYDFPDPADVVANAPPTKRDDVQFFYSSDTAFIAEELYTVTAIRILGTAIGGVPFVNGETKTTYFEDGGVDEQRIFADIEYQGYDVDTSKMPEHYMGINPNVDSAGYIPAFEAVMVHKFFSFEVWNDTTLGEEPVRSCISTILRALESNSKDTKVSNNIHVSGLVNKHDTAMANKFKTSYNAGFTDSVAITFTDPNWHVNPNSSGDYSMFKDKSVLGLTVRLPIIELLRNLVNQYGGATYEDKQRNSYLLNGNIIPITNGSVNTHTLGDVYIGPLIINRSDGQNTQQRGFWNLYEYVYIEGLEHNVDVYSRYDEMYNWGQGLDTSTLYGLYRLEDNHKLLGAYNQQNDLILGIAKPATFSVVETFNVSIVASKQKFPNEIIDSWTDFLINDVMDLDGIYGSITKIYNFTNEIFAFQSRGVSGITINPRIQIQADDGVGVELGTGTVLYSYKYLTTKSGTEQLWSVTDDGTAVFYYDDVAQSINVHTGEELSTVKKIRNLMKGITPGNTVRSVYDIDKQDVLFVFESTSIVYNKYIGEFTRIEDTHNYIHIFDNKVFSLVNDNLNEHYTGTDYNPMYITYMFAPMPTMDKVFHNIEYRKIGDNNFNYIKAEDTINRTGIINDPVISNKFNINRIHIPRIDNEIERFRDVNILLTLQCPQSADLMSVDDMVLMYNIKG